jgi:hypothetical protein
MMQRNLWLIVAQGADDTHLALDLRMDPMDSRNHDGRLSDSQVATPGPNSHQPSALGG